MWSLPRSLSFLGATALALPSPVQALDDESPAAVAKATMAAQSARDDMLETFGSDHLNDGQFLWQDGTREVTRVVVSLGDQLVYAYDNDQLVGVATTSTAREGYITPPGIFSVLAKSRTYRSKKFDNAPMPYAQRIDNYGIAMHGGEPLPGYPASHGCIRLPTKFAARLFAMTDIGTEVYIGGSPPSPDPSQVAEKD